MGVITDEFFPTPYSVSAGFNGCYSVDYGSIFEDIDKVMCWLSATNYNILMKSDWDDKTEDDWGKKVISNKEYKKINNGK